MYTYILCSALAVLFLVYILYCAIFFLFLLVHTTRECFDCFLKGFVFWKGRWFWKFSIEVTLPYYYHLYLLFAESESPCYAKLNEIESTKNTGTLSCFASFVENSQKMTKFWIYKKYILCVTICIADSTSAFM